MRAWLVLGLTLSFFVGCSSSHRMTRWEPYPGCGPDACQSWYDACRAECLNEEGNTVGGCQTQCGAKLDACMEACAGC